MPTATVRLVCPDGECRTRAAVGTGPVHAVFTAIDSLVLAPSELLEYQIDAVTEGIDALGHASVRVRANAADGRLNPQHGSGNAVFHGHAADTDVVVASTKAYLSALNRLLAALGSYDKQQAPTQKEDAPGAAE
ncbi:MAG: alpha-isopropylmalate synthase regulatory domain-containing protein [Polyangiaceae bacterium]